MFLLIINKILEDCSALAPPMKATPASPCPETTTTDSCQVKPRFCSLSTFLSTLICERDLLCLLLSLLEKNLFDHEQHAALHCFRPLKRRGAHAALIYECSRVLFQYRLHLKQKKSLHQTLTVVQSSYNYTNRTLVLVIFPDCRRSECFTPVECYRKRTGTPDVREQLEKPRRQMLQCRDKNLSHVKTGNRCTARPGGLVEASARGAAAWTGSVSSSDLSGYLRVEASL